MYITRIVKFKDVVFKLDLRLDSLIIFNSSMYRGLLTSQLLT